MMQGRSGQCDDQYGEGRRAFRMKSYYDYDSVESSYGLAMWAETT